MAHFITPFMNDYTTGSTDVTFSITNENVYLLSSSFRLASLNLSQTSYCIHINTEVNAYHTLGTGSYQRPAL